MVSHKLRARFVIKNFTFIAAFFCISSAIADAARPVSQAHVLRVGRPDEVGVSAKRLFEAAHFVGERASREFGGGWHRAAP